MEWPDETVDDWKLPAVSLADARNRAFDALRDVARGDDPQAEKISIRESGTFAELSEQYMDEWAKINKRSWREDQRKFDVYLLPKWKHVKASAITIDDVELLLEQLALRAPIQANRARRSRNANKPSTLGPSDCSLSSVT